MDELEAMRAERDRALIALWRIRMAAERSNLNDPVWALPNEVAFLALAGMGPNKQLAQRLAAK